MARKNWDEYFTDIARLVSERSTCLRRKVGAVAVFNKRILATGYNGTPAGLNHCLDIGCLREQMKIKSGERHELCQAVHAEQNVIIQAAVHGISIAGASLYISGGTPCFICAKMIVNSKFVQIICDQMYPDPLALNILEKANIRVVVKESESKK